jgi:hypothetical protein
MGWRYRSIDCTYFDCHLNSLLQKDGIPYDIHNSTSIRLWTRLADRLKSGPIFGGINYCRDPKTRRHKKIITGIMRDLPGVLAAKQVMEKHSTFNPIMG